MTIVLMEPDPRSRRIEAAALKFGGYDVATVQTVDQAVARLRTHQGEALLIDPAPVDTGALVGELRSQTDVPILIVTNDADEAAVVAALDAGADDYVVKPFRVEELIARLRAALRRVQRPVDSDRIVTEDFTIDLGARRAFFPDGSEIHLTGVEFRMIQLLLRRPGFLITQEELLEGVWGQRGLAKKNSYIRVYTNRIRNKLEPDPANPKYLHTASGLGLVFDVAGRHPRNPHSSRDV